MSGRHPSHSSAESSRDHAPHAHGAHDHHHRPPAAPSAQRDAIWALALTGGFASSRRWAAGGRLARAVVGRGPHADRRRGARPRAVRPADRRAAAVAAWLCARRGHCGVRQRAGAAGTGRIIVVEGGEPAAPACRSPAPRCWRRLRPRDQPRDGVDPVARDAHPQYARRAAACAVDLLGSPRRSSRARSSS